MKAIWRGRVIAESENTLDVGGYTYFPRDAVQMSLLHATPKTQSDLACPHGVQFYDVSEGATLQQPGRLVGTKPRSPRCSRSTIGSASGRTSRSDDMSELKAVRSSHSDAALSLPALGLVPRVEAR